MAIDYNAGITSIDSGAPDIKYTGDEGPKSPQEEMQIAGREYNRVLEILEKVRENIPLSEEEKEELQGLIKTLTAKGVPVEQLMGKEQNREGIMQMASDDTNERALEQIFEQLLEEGFSPEEAAIKAREMFDQRAMATGGRVGYAGGQLVKPGPGRPGYRGGAAYDRDEKGRSTASKSERGEGPTHSQRDTVKDESRRQQRQTTLPSYADEMDVKEQYRLGNEIKVGSVIDPVDRSKVAEGSDWAERKNAIEEFAATRPEVTGPWWAQGLQGFSDWTTERNRRWFADNVLRAGKLGYGYGDIDEDFDLEAAYQKYMADRMAGKIDAMGNPNPGYGRDDDRASMTQVGTDPTPDPTPDPDPDPTIPIDPVTGLNLTNQYHIPGASNFYSNLPAEMFDPATDMLTLADGGRARYAGGGIADLRQGYFLGKLVKGITKPFKGLTKGVKKFMKSPAGKVAMLAALGYGTGMFGSQTGGNFLSKMIGTGSLPPSKGLGTDTGWLGKALLKPDATSWSLGNISPWKAISAASTIGGLYTAMAGDKEEMPEWLKRWYAEKAAADAEFAPIGNPENWESIRFADGGRIGYAGGGYNDDEEEDHRSAALSAMYGMRRRAQEGGLMDLGGMEKDYRNEGGFVPIGGEERADDVPARLSKNEFVFTADAVRNAGGGDIDKGAEIMENVMENLENGGNISEESQGLEGARNMFATAQRLEGVM